MRKSNHLFVAAGVLVVGAVIGCGGNGTGQFGSTSSTSGSFNGSNTSGGFGNNTGQQSLGTQPGAPATNLAGNEILYAEFSEDGTTIEKLTADGKKASVMTKLPGGSPIYAQDPTATHVAFAVQKEGGQGLYWNTSTTPDNATSLGASNFTNIGSVQFTPSGDDVLYTAESASTPFSLYLASTTGKMVKKLDEGDDATISPNGKWVAYSKTGAGHSTLYVIGIDGKGAHPITTGKANDILPQWSKDGGKVLFTSDRDGQFAIYSVPVKGGAPTKVVAGDGVIYGGTPSPDGKKVAYSKISKAKDETGLFIANANGTLAHKVSDQPASTGVMYWTTPSVAVGKSATHAGAPAMSMSPRAKSLLKLPDAPAIKKVEVKADPTKDAKPADVPASGKAPDKADKTKSGG